MEKDNLINIKKMQKSKKWKIEFPAFFAEISKTSGIVSKVPEFLKNK